MTNAKAHILETIPTKPTIDWAKSDNLFFNEQSRPEIVGRLEAGAYTVGQNMRIGTYLERRNVIKDTLIPLPDTGAEGMLHEIRTFLNNKSRYEQRGLVHKRGILMQGPPGSGKTSVSELLCEMFVREMNGIVLLSEAPTLIADGLHLVRRHEPDRPVMVVIEDIDVMIDDYGDGYLLNLLDGKYQYDSVVVVASTNHLNNLPDRLVNRPSRFDLVVSVDMPSKAARDVFVRKLEPTMTNERVKRIVELTDDYSVAHLKELLLLTEVYDMPLERAVERLNAIRARSLSPKQANDIDTLRVAASTVATSSIPAGSISAPKI